jgi:hypothetical protein
MSKFAPDAVLDAALAEIATSTLLSIVSDATTPTDLTNTLASVSVTAGAGNGDFTIANSDLGGGGRMVTITAQSGISISASGTANHIVLSVGGTIKYVTTCTAQALTSGGTVDVPAWKIGFADPT